MPSVRRFEAWMRFSAFIYLVGGLAFALAPEQVFVLPERALIALLGVTWGPMPATPVFHWAALGISMMFTIATCSALASRNGRRNYDFAIPVMVSKGVSSIIALLAMALHGAYAIYLIVPLTDFPLMIITWWVWKEVRDDVADATTARPNEVY